MVLISKEAARDVLATIAAVGAQKRAVLQRAKGLKKTGVVAHGHTMRCPGRTVAHGP